MEAELKTREKDQIWSKLDKSEDPLMKLYKDLYVTKTMTEEQRRSSKLQHDFQNLPADVLLQAQRAVIVYDM